MPSRHLRDLRRDDMAGLLRPTRPSGHQCGRPDRMRRPVTPRRERPPGPALLAAAAAVAQQLKSSSDLQAKRALTGSYGREAADRGDGRGRTLSMPIWVAVAPKCPISCTQSSGAGLPPNA